MRSLILCLLACTTGLLVAYEEPTIIDSANEQSRRLLTFDSGTGMIRLYWKMGDRAMLLKSRHNFLSDLQNLSRITIAGPNPLHKRVEDQPEEFDYPLLQLGKHTSPAWAEFFDVRGKYFSPKASKPGEDPPLVQAVRTELEFWKTEPKYDGRAYAALSNGYVMVYVPSSYAILLYWLKNEDLQLAAYRNIRPEMMLSITDGFTFNSFPKFNTMKQKIQQMKGGKELLAMRMAALEETLEAMESEDQVMPVAASDPYVAGLRGDRFVILDVANRRLMVYDYTQRALELESLRNLELDLLMPTWPLPRNRDVDALAKFQVREYVKELRKKRMNKEIDAVSAELQKWCDDFKFTWVTCDEETVNLEIFRKLSALKDELITAGGGSKKPWDAAVIKSPEGGGQQLLFDHKGLRRLFVYDLLGQGNKIELLSTQAYDIDTAMEQYSAKLRRMLVIKDFYEKTEGKTNVYQWTKWLMKRVEYILKVEPRYHEVIAKSQRFKRWFKHMERWDKEHPDDQLVARYQTLVEEAEKRVEEQKKGWEKLKELVQDALIARENALQAMDDKRNNREEPTPPRTRAPAEKDGDEAKKDGDADKVRTN